MRTVLTYLAVALVAMLSVAAAAPLFIDWTAHRDEIAARLGAIAGGKVSLSGPVTIRLLPTPFLEVGEGSAEGAGPDSPRLSFASARLELAIIKLASGAIRFTEIQLEKPELTLTRANDGSLRLPIPPPREADAIGFDRLVVQDGTVRILNSSGLGREFDKVRLEADAASLAGPFHLSGHVAGLGEAPVSFRLASERSGPQGLPLRASVDAGPGWPALELDGAITIGAKGPSLSGSGALVGAADGPQGQTPWKASGRIDANLDGARIEQGAFQFGPDERALRADGSASLAFLPAKLRLDLKAKQANVDALLRRKDEAGVPPTQAFAFLSGALARLLDRVSALMSVDANLNAETVILGAETLPNFSGGLRTEAGAPLHADVDLSLPGRSRIRADGDVETGAAARFRGVADFSSGDVAKLNAWATQGAPNLAQEAEKLSQTLPYSSVAIAGDVDASMVGFSGRNLQIVLDRSTLEGALSYTSPAGSDPGRLYMDLISDSLDVPSLPVARAGANLLGGDLDLSLSLSAKALHIGQVGDADIDSASLAFKLTKKGADIRLDRLSVAELGGASIEADGAFAGGVLTGKGRMRADRLRDFALLLSRIAPGPWNRTLADRAETLSPVSLSFEEHGGSVSADAIRIGSLKANGTIGSTQAALSVDSGPKEGLQLVNLTLDSPDGGAFMRQLGVATGESATGRARLSARASGGWAAGYDVDGSASLVGADITGHGRFSPTAEGDAARLFGSAKLKAANIAPLLAALALAPQGGGAIGPADVAADATLRGDRWTISHVAASVAGVKATGDLAYQPAAKPEGPSASDIKAAEDLINELAPDAPTAPAELTGALALDKLPLSSLLALSLGPPQPVKAGARWSDAKFAPPPLNLPSAEVRLSVGALDAFEAVSAQGLAATLSIGKGKLELGDMAMKAAGGDLSGRLAFRRARDTATMTGTLTADQIAVNRPNFTGRISGTLEFASTGKSPAALVEGLAGSGSIRFGRAALGRSDLFALDRVVGKAQTSDSPLDELTVAYFLDTELNRGALAIPDVATPLALSAGVLKLGPIGIQRDKGEAELGAKLDLRTLAVETRLAVTSPSDKLKFWSGPPPSATVVVKDALEAPKRQLGVGSLSAGLATQAIARETDRIANLEADIRERAFFNRRLKGERFMDKRAAEIEDWRVEQARLKGLAEKLAAEKAAAEKAAAEKAAAEKAAAEKAAAEKAAAEKAAAEKAAAEKAAAEKAAAEKAAVEKVAAEKAAAEKVAAEKAAAEKAAVEKAAAEKAAAEKAAAEKAAAEKAAAEKAAAEKAAAEKAAAEKAAAEKAAAEKAAVEKAAAEKAAAEKAAVEKAAAEKAAAEKAAVEKAAVEKAAVEKVAAEKAAAEKAAAEKALAQPELPPDLPPPDRSLAPSQLAPRGDELGANSPPISAPLPPTRPKPRPARLRDPTASGLY